MHSIPDKRYYYGYVDGVIRGEIRGWVVDPENHSRPVTICIKVNNRLIARVCALHYRSDVASIFGTHGRHGFVYRLPEELRLSRSLLIGVVSDNGYPLSNHTFRYVRGDSHDDSVSTERSGPLKLFLHLPKTGGTAFRSLVRKRLNPTERLLIYPDPPGIPRESVSLLTESQLRQFKCIYGHFYFGLHQDLPVNSRYSTVLRNPISRVISHYFHYQRAGLADAGSVPSWKGTDERVAFELGGPPPSEEFDNLMVRMISGEHPPVGQVTGHHLYKAVRNLDRHFDFVGIQEDAKTWQDLKSYFDISSPMEHENVGGYNPALFDQEEWRTYLSRMNAYDMELYRYAQKLAAERTVSSAAHESR
jgi:hypothetical protein